MVIAVASNDKGNRSLVSKEPIDTTVRVSKYRLFKEAFLPTTKEDKGILLYDGEELPLDRVEYDNIRVADFNNRKVVNDSLKLTARLELRRTVYWFEEPAQDSPRYEPFKDSIIRIEDTVFLKVNSIKPGKDEQPLRFAIIVGDTLLVKQEDFLVGQEVELADSLVNEIGIDRHENNLFNGVFTIPRIAIVSKGHLYSFVKECQLVVVEDRSTPIPPTRDWVWIINGILILAALAGGILSLIKSRKKTDEIEPSAPQPSGDGFPDDETGGQLRESDYSALREQLEQYKKDAENWQELMQGLGKDAPKTASGVISSIGSLNTEIRLWKEKTQYDSPDSAATGINDLKKRKKALEETVARVKDAPLSFENEEGFDKLTKLIKDAAKGIKVRDLMNSTPEEIEPNSNTGILIRKGKLFDDIVVKIDDEIFKDKNADMKVRDAIDNCPLSIQVKKGDFLDKAKDDVKMIRKDEEGWIGECELKTFIEYVVNPHTILTSERVNTGLYKLMHDVDSVIAPSVRDHGPVQMDALEYNWLKERIGSMVEGYNDYLQVESAASAYGTPSYAPDNLKPKVWRVFVDASTYLEFCKYKNYWKNIASPLLVTLDGLHEHDETYNTRALMFYTSQFYSIASIMNEIFGDDSYPTTRPKINVGIFNKDVPPVLSPLGIPQLDAESLQRCKFEYKGARDEDQKVRYLKQYKPLPFIFIFSYFDDNILS